MAGVKSASLDDVFSEAGKYIKKDESIELIRRAAAFAEKAHEGQFRKSGDPYFTHVVNVAYILTQLRVGPSAIAAGFLHDTVEDTEVTKEDLIAEFGPEIAELVESVTKIGALKLQQKDDPEYQAENHRKIFIAMARDIRVILIKLADRLHNMRTLQYQKEESQKRIAAETLDVYAPIAHRLGISAIKNELEDLSFYYLNPEEYYRIAHLVETKKAERDASVNLMIEEISELLKSHNIKFRIFGRSKHLYSIYHKMEVRHKRFDEILDLLAIRVITETELNCYEILGYIHAKYRPIPGRLKDYIAVPKANMYQSLHTTIIGDNGRIFEVQIRTEEMDEIAEQGVAAHWRYKEGGHYDARAEQKEIEEKLSWFRDFAVYTDENQDASASEYMATLQRDIFDANVYVMTPKGKVIDLPNGATPIDFAYRIHTDVGHTTVGAIVNDVMVPLNTELHTGDVVQIKTMKNTGPSEDWLKFVKTNQAKNKIKAYFTRKEAEMKNEKVPHGEKLISDELRKRGLDPAEYVDRQKIEGQLSQLGVTSYVDMMYGLATRALSPSVIADKMTRDRKVSGEQELSRLLSRERKHVQSKTGIVIPGLESMKMTLAQCCLPVYGDSVVGYITKGDGVKIHRADCPNVAGMRQRMIDVGWDEGDRERLYESEIVIQAHDRNFLLTDVATLTSQLKAPMLHVSASVNRETLTSTIKLRIQVRNLEQLNSVIANLRKIESVYSVERETN